MNEADCSPEKSIHFYKNKKTFSDIHSVGPWYRNGITAKRSKHFQFDAGSLSQQNENDS